MAMVFSRSCSDSAGEPEFPGIWYVARPEGGDLGAAARVKAGETNYVKAFNGSFNRWGDYNGIAVDPADGSIWMFAEYAASPADTWGTWFGQLSFPTPNAIPVADDESVTIVQDDPATITLTGSDADTGDSLSFIITSLPGSGDLVEGATEITTAPHTLTGDTVTYTPDPGFSGPDGFTFKINDGKADSDTATVTVNVTPAGPATRAVTKTGDTSDGVCDADCSLREAIAAASSGDSIDVPAGVYTLTLGSELAINTGGLTNTISLTGVGPGDTIIQAAVSSADAASRVFNVTGGNVTISGVTIQHGRAIVGGGIINSGTLNIANSVVKNNVGSGSGGAIYNSGELTLTDSIVSGNTVSSDDPEVSIRGGGIHNSGTLTLTNSMVSNNSATGFVAFGGGVSNEGTVVLVDSTVSANSVSGGGGGIRNDSGGSVTSTNSAVIDNSASNGGGIENFASMTLTNSTVSRNSAEDKGGGIWNGGTLALANITISGNSASNISASSEIGGGIYNWSSSNLTQTNTIIADNTSGGDCDGAGTFTSLGHNLDSDGTCSLSVASGDMPNTDPLHGPLRDNGGATFTHALLPGSPAIDAGDDSAAPDTDQRGVPRPQGAHSDIGAYERGPDCMGHASTIVGTDGDETIVGTSHKDVIVAKGGSDTIHALGGADIVCAGPGNDEVFGGPGRDVLKGQGGKDKLFGEGGRDRLVGGRGRDTLKGGRGNDKLSGKKGDDKLFGGRGDDTMNCGQGSDTATGGPGNDTATGCETTTGIPTSGATAGK